MDILNGSEKPKKTLGVLIMLAALGVAGFAFYVYLLPLLITLAWNTAELIGAGIVAAFLVLTVSNPKFWRSLSYAAEWLNDSIMGLIINNNPWVILQSKIDSAKKDREQIRIQNSNLKAQQDSLSRQLKEQNDIVRQKNSEVQIAKQALQKNPNDEETSESLEISANDLLSAQNFIAGTQPIFLGICKLVEITDKSYRKTGILITNSQHTLDSNRTMYEAVTAGSKAMSSARKAMTGNSGINSDAEKALKYVNDDISKMVGNIQNSIQIIGQVMNSNDLSDAAKIQNVVQMANKFDANPDFNYSDTITDNRIGNVPSSVTSKTNKYDNLLLGNSQSKK